MTSKKIYKKFCVRFKYYNISKVNININIKYK